MKLIQLFILCSSFFVLSCTQQYYIPNAQNVPLFLDKNEAALNFSVGGATAVRSSNINAAYSITKNIALQANYMKFGSGTHDTFFKWSNGNYGDFSAGYFKMTDKNTVIEVFGGYGFSKQHHQLGSRNTNDGTSDLSYQKFFIQPIFGYNTPYFDLAFSAIASNVFFNKIQNNINPLNNAYSDVADINAHKSLFLLEPSFTIRGGWQYFKMQLQVALMNNFTYQELKFAHSNITAGIYFSFANRYKTNKK